MNREYTPAEVVAILKYGRMVKEENISWQAATRKVNEECSGDRTITAVRKKYADLVENQELENSYGEFFAKKPDGTEELARNIWVDRNFQKTPDNVMLVMGYDPDLWELQTFRIGSHEVAIKDDGKQVCYNFRAIMKPRLKEEVSLKEVLQVARDLIAREIKPLEVKITERKTLNKNRIVNLNAIEAHLGKLIWGGDTGDTNYDSKIAIECIKEIIKQVIVSQETWKADKIIIPIGSDFFNGEGVNGSTTAGTEQMNDGRYKKLFQQGIDAYQLMIETFKEHFNKIEFLLVEGNHDRTSSFYLYECLSRMYENDKQCNFSDCLETGQVYLFNDIVLFYHHGDTNQKTLHDTYAFQHPVEWGASVFRYSFTQHLHHKFEKDLDKNGIRQIGLPSICPRDDWHHNKRFIGARPAHEIQLLETGKGIIFEQTITFERIFNKHRKRAR